MLNCRVYRFFLIGYLIPQSLPLDPAVFLARTTVLPDFYRTVCSDLQTGVKYNNHIHTFLNFVLLQEFSKTDDNNLPVVLPAFRNPIPKMSRKGSPKRNESVHSPLPYPYIDELRQMLVMGSHFSDWHWAQSALGVKTGKQGHLAPDWFEVTEDQIDQNDPDCVWRVRKMSSQYYRNGRVLEMWSPVRWVYNDVYPHTF